MDSHDPQVVEGIAAAQEALGLLIPAGDFAGALDILCDLNTAGTPTLVTGLHAFRQLPQQLDAAMEVKLPPPPIWTSCMHGEHLPALPVS